MKKSKLLSLFFTLVCVLLTAAEHDIQKPLQIMYQSSSKIELGLNTRNYEIRNLGLLGEEFNAIDIEGFHTTSEEGMPELPFYTTSLAIPAQGDYSLRVTERNIKTISNVKVIPYLDDVNAFNRNSYSDVGIYPTRVVESSQPAILRDFRIIQLSIYPIRWDSDTGNLIVTEDIDITIDFNNNPSLNELPEYEGYSPVFEKLYASVIDNFDFYRIENIAPVHPRVLIIHGNTTDNTFHQLLNNFVAWKRQKGFDVNVASTQIAGSSNTAIKNYITTQYNNVNTRPDFIILVGDTSGSFAVPTWYESYSSYNGEGDYPYTHIVGGDLLGDIFIGRLSAENVSQFDVLLTKIYAYEKNVSIVPGPSGWLDRVLLIGDPNNSGISTIYTNKFVKERAKYANPNYSFIENYSSGFSSTINQGINQGVAFFNYRGYINMSGWSPSSTLTNGFKLPHSVIITCSTGSFAGSSPATTEAFVRLGTSATPSGALTAIGMATSGTHTGFNNSLTAGIFDGIFTHEMRTMGEALLAGRMNLYNVYHIQNPNQVNYFAHWCNLMGDPTVEVFVGIPKEMLINAPSSIPMGTHMVDVLVTDASMLPIKYAAVTIYSIDSSSVVSKGFTNELGQISLLLPDGLFGALTFTASKADCKPVQQASEIDATGSLVFESFTISDSPSANTSGNSNGVPNPGETVAMTVTIKNTTSETISGMNAVLVTADAHVNVLDSQSSFNPIIPGEFGSNVLPFRFIIGNNPPTEHDIRFDLIVTDNAANSYNIPIHVLAINAELVIQSMSITAGSNSVIDPSENGFISITIQNISTLDIDDITAELRSQNDLLVVTDSLSYYGTILAGNSVNSTANFMVYARPQLIPGMQIPMVLKIYNSNGFEQHRYFNLQIGTPTVNTPLGPDSYGYFIYDWTDTAFPDCPVYDWVDIHPSLGGSGTLIPLNDSGYSGEGDSTSAQALSIVDLPFTFGFYGIDYNQITVCSNGFIAMGVTENAEFRNYRLPGPLGPSPMIAPFWDNLVIIQDAGVYEYYNTTENTFIVQYHKLRNGYNNSSLETFQVIFYDPLYYPTGMGDGMIKIQYKDFNNVDIGSSGYTPHHGNYSTIGIKDHTNTRGLEYSYNNQYPTCAAPLSNQKALLITTKPVLHQNAYLVISETVINDANGNGKIEPGENVEIGFKLSNLGMNSATNVTLNVSVNNSYVTLLNGNSIYGNIAGSSVGTNIQPIMLYISPNIPAGQIINLICVISIDGNSWSYSINLGVSKPAIEISSVFINDLYGNSNGIVEPGETFKLILNYSNISEVEAREVTSNLFCSDERITIHNPELLLNEIPVSKSIQAVYQVSVSDQFPLGSYATFYLTYLGDMLPAQNQQIVISCGTTGMNSDFEQNDGGFVPSPTTNGWEWGVSTYSGAHSGSRVWGTRLNSQYPNNATYSLTSPSIYIGQNFVLEFYHRYDLESSYDGGNLKISTDNGSTWTLIHPENGYTHSYLPALAEAGFSGSLLNWTLVRFNLSQYQSSNVKFKWTFASDGMITGQGWFIDDVVTTGHVGFASMINGAISVSNDQFEPQVAIVAANNGMAVHPDSSGNYELFLPEGSFSVTASSPGFQAVSSAMLSTGLSNPIIVQDFYLGFLTPPSGIDNVLAESVLTINWQPPYEPEFVPVGYRVYRKLNVDRFEQIAQTTSTVYTEQLTNIGTYKYYVTCVYNEGESLPSEIIAFNYPITDTEPNNQVPLVTKLYHNYPNPFNPSTTIAFSLKSPGKVKLSVYNLKGQLVTNLVNEQKPAGMHSITWNGRDSNNKAVSSGIYLYRLETDTYTQTRKAMLMK